MNKYGLSGGPAFGSARLSGRLATGWLGGRFTTAQPHDMMWRAPCMGPGANGPFMQGQSVHALLLSGLLWIALFYRVRPLRQLPHDAEGALSVPAEHEGVLGRQRVSSPAIAAAAHVQVVVQLVQPLPLVVVRLRTGVDRVVRVEELAREACRQRLPRPRGSSPPNIRAMPRSASPCP